MHPAQHPRFDLHFKKLRERHAISAEEEIAIRACVSEVKKYHSDHVFIRRGERLEASTLLLNGIVCRFRDLRNGKRQISELHFAGDFVDLHSYTLKQLDHDIMSLTPCEVALVPHAKLDALFAAHPRIGKIYWYHTMVDAATHREWEVSLGQRSGVARLAHLLCEVRLRLGVVGLADDAGYALPLTQTDLAECLGMTVVHTNRCLRELREHGLVTFNGGEVTLKNLAGLKHLADFEPDYLYLGPQPG